MKVLTQILRPINFVHLANQIGGILHNPNPTPPQGGSSSSALVNDHSPNPLGPKTYKMWEAKHSSERIEQPYINFFQNESSILSEKMRGYPLFPFRILIALAM